MENKFKHLTPREALLLRPDADLGAVVRSVVPLYVLDDKKETMVITPLDISQGLVKIFLEILQNAIDSQWVNEDLKNIKVSFDPLERSIKVWNDGQGIPVVKAMIDGEEQYHITALFSRFHSSSNLVDADKPPYTGGRNGKGAKITNTWSTKFTVRTMDATRELWFEQTWTDNMAKTKGPVVKKKAAKRGYTEIEFVPDWTRFEMPEGMTDDIQKALTACVWGACACTPSKIKIHCNEEVLKCTSFYNFAKMYQKEDGPLAYDAVVELLPGKPRGAVPVTARGYDEENYLARMEVVVMRMEDHHARNPVGFVNALRCSVGHHMTHVYSKIGEHIKAKLEAKGMGDKYKLDLIKDKFMVVVRTLLKNPGFDSQTKERMEKPLIKDFGFSWEPSETFVKQIDKMRVVEEITDKVDQGALTKLVKTASTATSAMSIKRPMIPKYEPAEYAGRKGYECSLVIVEGDSAKNLIVSGFSVVGRQLYGVYPIRGKLKNVRGKSLKGGLSDSQEVRNILCILGVDFAKKQTCADLRYRHILVVTDMDADGAHIQGLLMNAISTMIPWALQENPTMIQRLATPELRLTLKKDPKTFVEFTSKPQFRLWMATQNLSEDQVQRMYETKYFKGLGSSTAQDAKRYFSSLAKLRISLVHEGQKSEDAVDDMFSKKREGVRKTLIAETYDPNAYTDYSQASMTWSEFMTKEVVPFSYLNCVRAIAHIADGLKPAHRQILYTMFVQKCFKERKVAEIAGSVIALTHYAHGEVSLQGTISRMAQDFWCTNNINLLEPAGFFGNRIGGRTSFSQPRYTFTHLTEDIVLALFPQVDMPLCPPRIQEGENKEPLVLAPILPLVLINGSEGMGTGWSHTIYPHNPLDVVEAVRAVLADQPQKELLPWFVHFEGTVERDPATQKILCKGIFEVQETDNDVWIIIKELPFQMWRDAYKDTLEEKYLIGGKRYMDLDQDDRKDKKRKASHAVVVEDDEEGSEVTTVNFEEMASPFIKEPIETFDCTETLVSLKIKCDKTIYHREVKGRELKVLGLVKSLSENNMHLWDFDNKLHKFANCQEIVKRFCEWRMSMYHKRKDFLLHEMEKDAMVLSNRARFVKEVAVTKTIVLLNRPKQELLHDLSIKHYDQKDGSYAYLLSISAEQFTQESALKYEMEAAKVAKDREILLTTSPVQMWRDDLDHFETIYHQFAQRRVEKYMANAPVVSATKKRRKV